MDRSEAIKILTRKRDNIMTSAEESEALVIAIDSLKTDEAYQLEYENRDVVEVVRCQDCKRWQLLSNSSIHYCIITHRFSGSKEFCNLGISYNKE